MRKIQVTGLRILKLKNGTARHVVLENVDDTILIGDLNNYRNEKQKWVISEFGKKYICDVVYREIK